MAQTVHADDEQVEQRKSGLYNCLSKIKKEEDERKDPKEIDQDKVRERNSEDKLADDLLEALEKNDASEVWDLVETNHPIKTLKVMYRVSKDIAKKVRNRAKSCNFHCEPPEKSSCIGDTYSPSGVHSVNETQQKEEERKDEARKRKWIKILSNPLYIGVEWLWRTNTDCQCEDCQENKDQDAIGNALQDAYLLDKIASCEHYYSLEDYKSSVEAYESFAADVLEESTVTELYEIMDIEGDGFLLRGNPQRLRKLDKSLSLLKIAVDYGRKKFVASARCQSVLDQIIFYKCPAWKDKGIMRKFAWVIVQLILTTILSPFYISLRIFEKVFRKKSCNICTNGIAKTCIERIKNLYEHPYSKFVNHMISYILFLSLLLLSTFGFENEYKSTSVGLTRIDYAVIIFTIGLVLQEFLEAKKQGIHFYFSNWWKKMHILTLVTFAVSYIVWLAAWVHFGEWKPRGIPFIVADVFYATGTVMAFFHFTYIFQVSSTLGPLQLSLYRMLKDICRFLIIYFTLFLAFGAGLVKLFSYYVSSRYKREEAADPSSHYVARHDLAATFLVSIFLGNVDHDKLKLEDPAFILITEVGRIFLFAYGICTTLVAINMLIAMMTNSFERIMEDADQEWKFSRSLMWMDYINEGNLVPVPFNIAYYSLYLFFIPYYIFRVCCGKEKGSLPGTQPPNGTDVELEQMNFEHGTSDKSSAHSCSCICSWCCFPYSCQYGSEEFRPTGPTFTYCFSCICPGCSCFCKPTKAKVAREERLQAIRFSVARYLNNHYPNEETELQTSALANSVEAKAGEGVRE
ncbi:short transient receptor potential channel 4-like isoform X1 [Stylophora pistillata]|uniref:Short transient receptor potential channel 5 n=1 Tax=Stylophora pistillata TaxID=50429 RepID=A0A2B4SCN2_STYPI|nr:short transient receptor potential channel 4-like isoform X1 [Stylophora pistillata]PFX26205.1 Short transient receptor potential channel 5 [Stylophora pistillata]